MRKQELTMSGPRALQRGFGRWFAWSAFAPASRMAEQRRTAASRLGTLPQRADRGLTSQAKQRGREPTRRLPDPRPLETACLLPYAFVALDAGDERAVEGESERVSCRSRASRG